MVKNKEQLVNKLVDILYNPEADKLLPESEIKLIANDIYDVLKKTRVEKLLLFYSQRKNEIDGLIRSYIYSHPGLVLKIVLGGTGAARKLLYSTMISAEEKLYRADYKIKDLNALLNSDV